MKRRLLAGLLGSGLMVAPFALAQDKPQKPKQTQTSKNTAPEAGRPRGMSEDMRQAIAFERYKDLAAARQERKEARHPSVTYNNAERSTDREAGANRVKDPGPKK